MIQLAALAESRRMQGNSSSHRSWRPHWRVVASGLHQRARDHLALVRLRRGFLAWRGVASGITPANIVVARCCMAAWKQRVNMRRTCDEYVVSSLEFEPFIRDEAAGIIGRW